jgi:hypothetical protein
MIGNVPITLKHLPITSGQTGYPTIVIGNILLLIGGLPIMLLA